MTQQTAARIAHKDSKLNVGERNVAGWIRLVDNMGKDKFSVQG